MVTTDRVPSAYKIILSDDPDELAGAVEKSLPDGWIPHGGICIAFDPREMLKRGKVACAQAMVQYRDLGPSEG